MSFNRLVDKQQVYCSVRCCICSELQATLGILFMGKYTFYQRELRDNLIHQMRLGYSPAGLDIKIHALLRCLKRTRIQAFVKIPSGDDS